MPTKTFDVTVRVIINDPTVLDVTDSEPIMAAAREFWTNSEYDPTRFPQIRVALVRDAVA